MNAIYDAVEVQIDQHRWYATVLIRRPDPESRPVEIYICADSEHSGLWVGSPSEHEEH